jgi:hypothetical protein
VFATNLNQGVSLKNKGKEDSVDLS